MTMTLQGNLDRDHLPDSPVFFPGIPDNPDPSRTNRGPLLTPSVRSGRSREKGPAVRGCRI